MTMYKVAKTTPGQAEQFIAAFFHLTDARRFIGACIAEDQFEDQTGNFYHLYDVTGKLAESFEVTSNRSHAEYNSGFNPTPLPTTPRPKGGPPVTRRHEADED